MNGDQPTFRGGVGATGLGRFLLVPFSQAGRDDFPFAPFLLLLRPRFVLQPARTLPAPPSSLLRSAGLLRLLSCA